jgi:hypothetical protein
VEVVAEDAEDVPTKQDVEEGAAEADRLLKIKQVRNTSLMFINVYICVRVHTYMHAYIHMGVCEEDAAEADRLLKMKQMRRTYQIYMYMHICIHAHTLAFTYMRARAHTHTQTPYTPDGGGQGEYSSTRVGGGGCIHVRGLRWWRSVCRRNQT